MDIQHDSFRVTRHLTWQYRTPKAQVCVPRGRESQMKPYNPL